MSLHAEVNTLSKYLKRKKHYKMRKNSLLGRGGTMYVVRLMKTRTCKLDTFEYLLGCSKTCERCNLFMYKHSVSKIKYTDVVNGVNVLCTLIKS